MAARLRWGGELAGLAAAYIAVARLGLLIDPVSGFATLVWPATGIALTALLIGGIRLWPAIFVGALVANLWSGASLAVAGGIGAGNALEAVLAAWALRRYAGFRPSLGRLRDVIALMLIAAVGSTAVSATIGVASLLAGGAISLDRFAVTWRAWWLGDAISDLVIAPLLLTWSRERLPSSARLGEVLAFAVAAVAVSTFVFLGVSTAGPALRQPFLLFPLIIWACVRLGPRGAAANTFLLSAFAILGTLRGTAPESGPGVAEKLIFLQSFMAIVAVSALLLAAAMRERRDALRARDEVMAVVAHDLKSPLGAINLMAGMLLKAAPEPAARNSIEVMSRAGARMRRLIDDLADFSAIDAGHLDARILPEAAGAAIADAVELARPLAAARDQRLEVAPIPDLRPVACDRERIAQVLGNLIGNAIKFSPAGSTTSIAVTTDGGSAHYSVADTGPGFAPALSLRIFEPYYRGNSKEEGTGLGLAIARGIIDAHGGEIWAESEPGRGSTFHFTLPFAR